MSEFILRIQKTEPDLKTKIQTELNRMEQHQGANISNPAEKQDLFFKALSLYCQDQKDREDHLLLTLQTGGFSTTIFYELCNGNKIDCRFSTFLGLSEIFQIPDDLWFIPLIKYLIGENKED